MSGHIRDTLYSDIFNLVKQFCAGGRTSLFCHFISLSRGTWQNNTSVGIEPNVSNIKTSLTASKVIERQLLIVLLLYACGNTYSYFSAEVFALVVWTRYLMS